MPNAVARAHVRMGWAVCNTHGDLASRVCDTEAEARRERDGYPVGCGYHVRPVRVTTEVLGEAPRPWCFRSDGRAL